MEPPNLENSGFPKRKTMIFRKSVFRKSHRFLIDLGPNLLPFWLPKSSKMAFKTDVDRHEFLGRILDRFFCHLGALFKGKTAQDGPKRAPRRPQEAPKFRYASPPGALFFRSWAPRPPKRAPPQEGPDPPPRGPGTPSKTHFDVTFCPIFNRF